MNQKLQRARNPLTKKTSTKHHHDRQGQGPGFSPAQVPNHQTALQCGILQDLEKGQQVDPWSPQRLPERRVLGAHATGNQACGPGLPASERSSDRLVVAGAAAPRQRSFGQLNGNVRQQPGRDQQGEQSRACRGENFAC
ncbi:uncharacterized protein BKA78DRAFT_313204 [Phyllosticta capitalensis]|uniref:uncharacterized protein n=1 Tax=Phyllosticta capitalensis TaxID=121624 RepID=UPI00312D5BBA